MSEPFTCGLPSSDEESRDALQGARTIAVVGISPQPDRDSNRVASYLRGQGYQIIPIRPGCDEILGEKAYPSLSDYGRPVDIVDIFRKSEAVPGIVDEAIRLGAKVVWMQEGISHELAADKARAAGLKVVQNRCLMKTHQALHA